MKHWLQKVGLYYVALFRYRMKHVFRPITFGWEDVAEFLGHVIGCIISILVIVVYPVSYVLLVLWRLSEPIRCARKVEIKNIRKFLEKQATPATGETETKP